MAKTKHILHQPIKNPLILAVIALIIIITFVSLYINKAPSAGQAVNVGEAQWAGGTVNLEQEGTITFTVLPTTRREVNFTISNAATELMRSEYNFTLIRLDAQNYQFIISFYPGNGAPQQEVARDVLSVSGAGDRSLIYLKDDLATPQLEVVAQNNQVILRNYHFIPPTTAKISLLNYSTDLTLPPTTQLPIIPIQTGRTFTYVINASSIIAPEEVGAIVSEGTLTFTGITVRDTERNFTTQNFTYIAPSTPTAVLLDVNATVLGRVTHAYYTIAVGDRVYALTENNFPAMQFILDSANASNSNLIISLRATTELQPLALPCDVAEPFSTLFAGKAVRKMYTYHEGNPQVWTNGSAANDFTSFAPFRGYFVQLSEAQSTSLSVRCTVNSTEPITSAPPSVLSLAPTPTQLTAGWNLFAMRGIVPRALTDFTTDTSFTVFECQQNYACSEISRTTPLNPGKPYWIYTATPLTINYWLR